MDPRTWPLSVAATQLLIDLRPGKRPATTDSLLAQLTVKELLTRGGLRIDEILRRSKKDQIIVSYQPLSGTVPPTVALMATKLQRARQQQLQSLMKSTFRANRDLPRRLRATAEEELVSRGLAEWASRRVLGLFPQRYLSPTTNGLVWQQHANDVIERGEELEDRDTPPTPAEVDALGPLLVLVPGGLSMGARTAAAVRRDRRRDSSSGDSTSFPTDSSYPPTTAVAAGAAAGATVPGTAVGADAGPGGDVFLPLDGLGHSLGGFLDDALSSIDSSIDAIGDTLDSAVDSISDSLDSAIDSIDSAIGSIDSAIDSGISDGGSFDGGGGDSGGGGDGGGGGGGD